MNNRWSFLLNRLGEQLWVKPLLMSIINFLTLRYIKRFTDTAGDSD